MSKVGAEASVLERRMSRPWSRTSSCAVLTGREPKPKDAMACVGPFFKFRFHSGFRFAGVTLSSYLYFDFFSFPSRSWLVLSCFGQRLAQATVHEDRIED
jgi:hypothetical protein